MRESGELLESANVFGNYYGTPRLPVEKALDAGRDVLFDIDWQGTQAAMRENARAIWSACSCCRPRSRELEARLSARAEDNDDVIRRRMSKAAEEITTGRNTTMS